MATISKRMTATGISRYTVQVRVKGLKKAIVKTFGTRKLAKRWAKKIEAQIEENGADVVREADKHTLDDAITRYKKDKIPELRDPASITTHLDWWSERLGAYTLARISPGMLSDAKSELRATKYTRADGPDAKQYDRSPATVNRYMASLSRVLGFCASDLQWLKKENVPSVSKFKEPRGRIRALSSEELQSLRAAIERGESRYLSTITEIALATGARRNEISSLTWDRVDLHAGTAVILDTKNGDARMLDITGEALKALKELSRVRHIKSPLVFPSPTNPHTPYDFKRAWLTALRRAGIENFRFHDLRHTAASYLAMSNVTQLAIAARLGHRSLAMTHRYSHLTNAHLRADSERMAAKFLSKKVDDDEAAPAEPASSASA